MIHARFLQLLLLTLNTCALAVTQGGLFFPALDEKSPLFNTKCIAKPEAVEKLLLSEDYGFKKSQFTTPDNLKLECLVRSVEKPAFTTVISAGFFPGLMTGMSTLTTMLPKNCNIIFYNNRGKGNSEGWWVPRLWDYGTHEYKDVIGACDYAKTFNAPLVLYGTCAGTFANTKALCNLHTTDKLKDYNVKAHIMDSTVTDLPPTVERIPTYTCPSTFWGWVKTMFLWSLRYTIFNKFVMTSGNAARLDPKILAATTIPTLHFDCVQGDLLTPYAATHAFYETQKKNMLNPELCIKKSFDTSSHANHVLKHKTEYAFVLAGFLNQHI
jgi:hypothetical protein